MSAFFLFASHLWPGVGTNKMSCMTRILITCLPMTLWIVKMPPWYYYFTLDGKCSKLVESMGTRFTDL